MTIAPKKIETAYQALCDLGLSLIETGHTWTDAQRKAWERAERALRPSNRPNVSELSGTA